MDDARATDPSTREAADASSLMRQVRCLLRLHRALLAYDPRDASAVHACRAATLRYLEALDTYPLAVRPPEVRQPGVCVGPGIALRRLRAAAQDWRPPHLSAADRLALDARLRYWVGTHFGLRWR